MIYHFAVVDSTNILATRMAAQGAAQGTVIHADQQTGGRGRAGREFVSPPGGLYFSLILRPVMNTCDLPLITLAAGAGLCAEIRKTAHVDVRLKWPNDLYFTNRKLGGILTESGPFQGGSGPDFVIVGVGINVRTPLELFPSTLRNRAVSLYHAQKQNADVELCLQALVDSILSAVHKLTVNREQLLADWRTYDYLLGRKLEYEGPAGVTPAIGRGLAADGRYVVSDQKGVEHHIVAGDINPINLLSP